MMPLIETLYHMALENWNIAMGLSLAALAKGE